MTAPSGVAPRRIVVLGMHRSGTSAVTRAIGALGADMGPAAELRRNAENLPLRRVNERLLALGGGTWDGPPHEGWLDGPGARALTAAAKATLSSQLGDGTSASGLRGGVTVWKDPRTCLTLPFWLRILGDPVFVLVHRHPEEVAASLSARNGLGRAHAYALWERHNAGAVRGAVGHPAVVVSYHRLVVAPIESLRSIRAGLAGFGVELPHEPSAVEHGLTGAARHHTAPAPDRVEPEVATAAQRALLQTLHGLEGTHDAVPTYALPGPHQTSVELLDMARRLRIRRREQRRAT